tara:strand:- start:2911 stop:3363 length:453 start_codon:yes stop_codon:yes gene_type:complete
LEGYILVMIGLVKANKSNIDMNFILKIRNEKLVRKFSKNNKIISSINHKKWYLNNEKKEIYIITYQEKKVGYIRCDYKYVPILSWAISPKYRGKNIGEFSLKKFLKKKKIKTCSASIDENNIPSLIMVIKNNFKLKKKNKNFLDFYYKKN